MKNQTLTNNSTLEQEAEPAFSNPALSAEERTKDLLSRMTLEEKAAQMVGVWNELATTLVDEKGNDIFIHNSQIQNILTEGVKVLCEVFETPNGLRAKNVRIVTLAELPERVSEES